MSAPDGRLVRFQEKTVNGRDYALVRLDALNGLEAEVAALREKVALADTLRADLNGGHSVYWMADRLEKWSEEYDALDAAQKEGR